MCVCVYTVHDLLYGCQPFRKIRICPVLERDASLTALALNVANETAGADEHSKRECWGKCRSLFTFVFLSLDILSKCPADGAGQKHFTVLCLCVRRPTAHTTIELLLLAYSTARFISKIRLKTCPQLVKLAYILNLIGY